MSFVSPLRALFHSVPGRLWAIVLIFLRIKLKEVSEWLGMEMTESVDFTSFVVDEADFFTFGISIAPIVATVKGERKEGGR